MFCRECGKKIKEGVKFCGSCGTPITKKGSSKPMIVGQRDEGKQEKGSTDKHEDRFERRDREDREEQKPRSRSDGSSHRCPVCNNKVEYIEKYQKYYCDRCRKYPFDEQATQQTSSTMRSLYASTLIVSIIGGIMLITTEFSGGYSYHYGTYVRTSTRVSIGPWGLLFIVFFAVAMLLFIGTIISIRGLSPSKPPTRNMVWLGLICALTVLIITILGAISSFVFIDTYSIWLSEGFYGGSISSLLTTIFFWMILRHLPATPKPQQNRGYPRYPPNQRSYGRPHRP